MTSTAIIGEPEVVLDASTAQASSAWQGLKAAAIELQPLQVKDGSIPDAGSHLRARACVGEIIAGIQALAPAFGHDEEYLTALVTDFRRWTDGGFGVPDFHDSLVAFRPELTDELRVIVPAGELVEQQIRQFERGLKYVQGKYEGMLEPGKHAFWVHPGARVAITVMDTRVQQLKIEGQELMTSDKVTLRLTLTAEYAPADAPTTVHAVADVKDALYLAVQLAAREFVQAFLVWAETALIVDTLPNGEHVTMTPMAIMSLRASG